MVNRVEIIRKAAENTGYTQKDIKAVLESVQDIAFNALKDGENVKILDGVVLSVVRKDAHTARNPRTGEGVPVPARNVPKCKFGKALKDYINS
jgi:DNA-binding protein HU-beta